MPYTDTIRIIAGNTANIALNAIPADTSVRLSSPMRRPTRNTISRQPRAGIWLGYSAVLPRPSLSIPVPLSSTFELAMSLGGDARRHIGLEGDVCSPRDIEAMRVPTDAAGSCVGVDCAGGGQGRRLSRPPKPAATGDLRRFATGTAETIPRPRSSGLGVPPSEA